MLGPAVAAASLEAFGRHPEAPAAAALATSLLGGLRSGGESRASHSRSSSTPCLGSSCF